MAETGRPIASLRDVPVSPSDRRAALLMRIDHGLPYEQIAEAMGWNLQKVKNEIHRARLQLRERLSGYVEATP